MEWFTLSSWLCPTTHLESTRHPRPNSPNLCPTCSTTQHAVAQCPHKYPGPETFPSFACAHMIQSQDPTWYSDTSATHHMIGQLSTLQWPRSYTGNDSVFMGNGDSLPITHTDNLPISLSHSPFSRRNVFGVPHLTKKILFLLSILLKIIMSSLCLLQIFIAFLTYILVSSFSGPSVRMGYTPCLSPPIPLHLFLLPSSRSPLPLGTTVLVTLLLMFSLNYAPT